MSTTIPNAAKVTAESQSKTSDSDRFPQDWLRIHEAVAYSRLSKPKLYDLINRGLIKSVSLRERGQIKGTRLLSYASLRAFLESRATGGNLPPAE